MRCIRKPRNKHLAGWSLLMPCNSSSSTQRQKSKFPIQQFSTAMGHLNMPDGQVQAEKLLGQIPVWVWNQEPEPQAEEASLTAKALWKQELCGGGCVLLSFPCPVSVETTLPGAMIEQKTSACFSGPWVLTAVCTRSYPAWGSVFLKR